MLREFLYDVRRGEVKFKYVQLILRYRNCDSHSSSVHAS